MPRDQLKNWQLLHLFWSHAPLRNAAAWYMALRHGAGPGQQGAAAGSWKCHLKNPATFTEKTINFYPAWIWFFSMFFLRIILSDPIWDIWLVVSTSEKYEFVSWEDDIPNIFKNKSHVPNQQPDQLLPSSEGQNIRIEVPWSIIHWLQGYLAMLGCTEARANWRLSSRNDNLT